VKRAVEEAPEGWRSLREVRKVIAGGELKDRLRKSDKGYYHALSRLVERKVLARHKGWLVMPYRYDAFIRAVEKGEVKPDGPIMRGGESRTGSLMGDEIYARIELLGPQSSAEIIAHLRQSREFATTVARNSSSAYNVMSRLVSRGQLKRAEGLYDIGTDNVTDTKTPSQESPREGALL
jgi:hypothetical protein